MRLRWHKGEPLVLSTERFTLTSVSRRWIARHTFAWTRNEDVMAGLELPLEGWHPRRWHRQFSVADNHNTLCLAIHDRQDRRLIGFETVQITGRRAFLTVAIGETDWWGRRVVMETRAAILDYLFNVRHCARVWGTPSARNFPSIYNYMRLGFRQEGVLRHHGRSARGEPLDMIAFSILPDEWRAHLSKDGQ